ncbi:phosphotransferase [Mangrovicoccus ximenensis]|uniref:phosphotransferase n=1 Tax=Mangrovicoccus ximenensis TaxID=1911570 RepID=UPI001374EF2E|nr:phosphotransferase [Mangrovicoccus ximenensis]
MFSDLRATRSHHPARLRARLARLRRRRLRAAGAAGPATLLHGDFHAGNLFVRDGRMLGFDREYDVHGPAHHDLAKFLVDLGMRRAEAEAEGTPWDGDADTDRRCFFEGYGRLDPETVAAFDLAEDLVAFRLWNRGIKRRGSSVLDGMMRARGLVGDAAGPRPGRLVAGLNGAEWTDAEMPGARRGLLSLHPGKLTGR